jgi:membrane-bound inhibitor of C-type lysozyme
MIKRFVVLAALLTLAGCATHQVSDVTTGETWIWRCDRGVTFTSQQTSDGNVEVVAAGRTYRLPGVIAGSGVRYFDGQVEFWEHGGEAMLNGAAGGPYENCANREGDVLPAH